MGRITVPGWLSVCFNKCYRSNQEVVEEAFLPTLKTLLNAPATSPLAEVYVNNVAELLVQLTNTKLITQNQKPEESSQVGNKVPLDLVRTQNQKPEESCRVGNKVHFSPFITLQSTPGPRWNTESET